MKCASGALTNGLIGAAAFFAVSLPVAALARLNVSFDNEAQCNTLLAGQHLEAGKVCVAVDQKENELLVTYRTENGWELTEAQLWAGLALADLPAGKNGNPQIGRFPHSFASISGVNTLSFPVPLSTFDFEGQCRDAVAYLAAHAVLQRDNGDGTCQTETGWVEGEQITAKGSWAMYSSILFTCTEEEQAAAQECSGPETAFAFGDRTFTDILGTPRWGWQLAVNDGESREVDLYAGQDALVGSLFVERDGADVYVRYEMQDGFVMDATHLYVGAEEISSIVKKQGVAPAPGQYGNQHNLTNAATDVYLVTVADAEPDQPLYAVAHAVVLQCQ